LAHWRWIREQRFDVPPLERAFTAPLFALEQALARQAERDKELEALATTEPYREPVAHLRCFRGIGTLSAIIVLAEVVDFQRFPRPRALMAYLGLVPGEYSSGDTHRRGALAKAANSHARRILIEAAWHYRHRPCLGPALAHRSPGHPAEIVGEAWRAQQRLHRRYRHLIGHGKRAPVAVVAVARELVGFIWAATTHHERRAAVAYPPGARLSAVTVTFPSDVGQGAMRARLESPRRNSATSVDQHDSRCETETAPDEPVSCGSARQSNPRISV
jgi:hypothetical protein